MAKVYADADAETPAEVANLIHRCLDSDPNKRPSAKEAYSILEVAK